MRFSLFTFLSLFSYVRAMQREFRQLALHCRTCHGYGKLMIAGGTISCPTCRPWRDLIVGKM